MHEVIIMHDFKVLQLFFNVSFNGSHTGNADRLRHAKKVGILAAYSSVTYLMTPRNPPTKRRTSNPISASRYLYKQMHINKSRWGKDDKRC